MYVPIFFPPGFGWRRAPARGHRQRSRPLFVPCHKPHWEAHRGLWHGINNNNNNNSGPGYQMDISGPGLRNNNNNNNTNNNNNNNNKKKKKTNNSNTSNNNSNNNNNNNKHNNKYKDDTQCVMSNIYVNE